MLSLRLVPALVLFLFQLLNTPDQAQAWWWCCPCGESHWYCELPGDSLDCPWCPKPDYQSGDKASEMKLVPEPLSVAVMKPDFNERLVELRRGRHVRGNFTLEFFDTIQNRMEFACSGSDENDIRDGGNTLLQVVRSYVEGNQVK